MSSAYTTEEVRERFINQVCELVRYWHDQPGSDMHRISGAVFSALVILDGENGGMPGFQVIPDPHPDDKAYHIERGEPYYPREEPSKHDIAGGLHDMFIQRIRNLGIE